MKIIITEEQKKKLFIPRKLEGEGSRWEQWNKDQPIKDGKPINQYDLDGREQGYWETYWDNGILQTKGSFIDGEKHGIWETYYWGGEIDSIGEYKNNEKDGIWMNYHDNGKLYTKGTYKNGKRNGHHIQHYYNGNVYINGIYKNDEFIGEIPLTESEQPKKKLFIPRKFDERYLNHNEQQPTITIDNHNLKLNQYDQDGNQIGLWLDNPTIIKKNYFKTKSDMEELFNNLKVVKSNNGNTDYKLNNKIIFQHRTDDNVLTYFINEFWRTFKEKYSLYKNYTDTKDIIKLWMEIKYNLGHLYPNQER